MIASPEEYSPIVSFEKIISAYVGRKLEVRWTVEDSETEKDYLHCFKGEIIKDYSVQFRETKLQRFPQL